MKNETQLQPLRHEGKALPIENTQRCLGLNLSWFLPVTLVLFVSPFLVSPVKFKRRRHAGVCHGGHTCPRLCTPPSLSSGWFPRGRCGPFTLLPLCLRPSRCGVTQHNTGSALDGAPAGGTWAPGASPTTDPVSHGTHAHKQRSDALNRNHPSQC